MDPSVLRTTVPRELQARDQWVVWRSEVRADKPTKVPYNPATGRRAKADDPGTWTSFSAALQALANGRYSGLGFEFSSHDPICGIDLDRARDEDGAVLPWAQELLDLLPPDCYTEISPSGRGLHVFLRGSKTHPRCRTDYGGGAVEIYDHRRYFTVTGDLLSPGSRELVEAQEALDRICAQVFGPHRNAEGSVRPPTGDIPASDDELLHHAFASQNGSRIEALWNGDTGGYPSPSEADLALCSHLWFWTGGDPARVDALFRRSGLMRPKWNREGYRRATIARAAEGATAAGAGRLEATAGGGPRTSSRRRPEPVVALDPQDQPQRRNTHRANAWRIARFHGGELRFAPGLGFLVYDGRRWKPSKTGALRIASRVSRYVCEEVADLMREAAQTKSEERRKALEAKAQSLGAWARTSEQGTAIRQSLELTAPLVEIDPGELDRHPLLLNIENGTLDLSTGEIRPHDPADFLTRCAPVRFDRQAGAPRWQEFIHEIMGGQEALVRYLQKALGYSITGHVREQCLFFAYGEGQNGKSTLFDVVREVLGAGYVKKAAPDLLLDSRVGRTHPSEVADLRGARLALCQEVAPGKSFDSQKLKDLTGERWLKSRPMYGDWFEFEATFTLWLIANHRPRTKDQTFAFWRRMRLIPFTQTIANPIPDFPSKLAVESAGILNWLLEGACLYLKEGLEPPVEVTQAVEGYRRESDSLGQFLAECCLTGDGREVRATELWTAYTAYTRERGLATIRRGDLKMEMLNRGFEQPPRRSTGFYYTGVGLRDGV